MDFLKDVRKYARVGTMMAKECVKKRLELEQGMSYTEFPLMFFFFFLGDFSYFLLILNLKKNK